MAGKLQLQKEIDSIRIFASVYSTKLRGDDLAFGGGDWYGDLHAPAASVVRTPVGPNWPPGTLLQDEGVTKLELELLLSVHKCAMAMDAVTNAGLDSDDDISYKYCLRVKRPGTKVAAPAICGKQPEVDAAS
ncbi:hypothetical protein C8F04DRAFT_1200870 [Mycena alexandri]|uniref:Uncharacterized protein n=1 Tax=Mycena alexandri TaxID=1745969 RepID=A0AAD6RXQ7_9AGAR|nr:hypothetical protein C8F04DRAFT_1200870 [Mycena alexandri]